MLPCFHHKGNLPFLPLPDPGILRVRFWNLLWVFSPVITASVSSPEVVSAIMMFYCPFVSSNLFLKACGPGTKDPTGPESHRAWMGPRCPLLSCSWPLRCWILVPPRSQPGEMDQIAGGQGQNLWGRHPSSFTWKTRGVFSHISNGSGP